MELDAIEYIRSGFITFAEYAQKMGLESESVRANNNNELVSYSVFTVSRVINRADHVFGIDKGLDALFNNSLDSVMISSVITEFRSASGIAAVLSQSHCRPGHHLRVRVTHSTEWQWMHVMHGFTGGFCFMVRTHTWHCYNVGCWTSGTETEHAPVYCRDC